MKTDVRGALEAISAGKATGLQPGEALINEALARDRQADFHAWLAFAAPHGGEALSAPAEILAPLP